jgi:alkanesulfonate monooxygenase SsuD/methylene tetrahydromethanopterin reductase-like flavin-dependent oxidoreductase (luciferase family)
MSTPKPMPSIALAAMHGRRRATLELAQELERQGFAGLYCASFGDALGLCEALALTTSTIHFGTAISIIYTRHVNDWAQTASLVHELSGGRFHFGVGVSHGAIHRHLGITVGKPLADMRAFVKALREVPRVGDLPPIVLAGLRDPMVKLAGEVAEGVVFANAARSYMGHSLSVLPAEKQSSADFFVGNMIPTCISDDVAAAAAVNRKTLSGYVTLPNYREYWKKAGYVEEMTAIEQALERKDRDALPGLMSDRWLADTTLYGPATKVREGFEQWLAAGVRTPILVPSSANGNQMVAMKEMMDCFAR